MRNGSNWRKETFRLQICSSGSASLHTAAFCHNRLRIKSKMKTKATNIKNLNKEENLAVGQFIQKVLAVLGDNLHMVRLFGSKARGDSHQESDIDMFMVIGHKGEQVREAITDAELDILLRHQLLITTIMESIEEFNHSANLKTNFFLNVMEEGIDLWISPEMKARLSDL